MCQCTPEIRTPFCGKPGCEWPKQETKGPYPDTALCDMGPSTTTIESVQRDLAEAYKRLALAEKERDGWKERCQGEVKVQVNYRELYEKVLAKMDRLSDDNRKLNEECSRLRGYAHRMAEVALSYGCHRAGCIHEQKNDCNCGLWRELGMLG
jgi:hypothetical protein